MAQHGGVNSLDPAALPAAGRGWEWGLLSFSPLIPWLGNCAPFGSALRECGSCFHTTAGEQILVFVLWLLECADMKDRIIAWVYNKLLIVPYIKKNWLFLTCYQISEGKKILTLLSFQS